MHPGKYPLCQVLRMDQPDPTTLAMGTDLTTLGLNLNSPEQLYRTFASPWADRPLDPEPDFKARDSFNSVRCTCLLLRSAPEASATSVSSRC